MSLQRLWLSFVYAPVIPCCIFLLCHISIWFFYISTWSSKVLSLSSACMSFLTSPGLQNYLFSHGKLWYRGSYVQLSYRNYRVVLIESLLLRVNKALVKFECDIWFDNFRFPEWKMHCSIYCSCFCTHFSITIAGVCCKASQKCWWNIKYDDLGMWWVLTIYRNAWNRFLPYQLLAKKLWLIFCDSVLLHHPQNFTAVAVLDVKIQWDFDDCSRKNVVSARFWKPQFRTPCKNSTQNANILLKTQIADICPKILMSEIYCGLKYLTSDQLFALQTKILEKYFIIKSWKLDIIINLTRFYKSREDKKTFYHNKDFQIVFTER